MKRYYRVMLGRGSEFAQECFNNNFIGADFAIDQDLAGQLPDEWRDFNKKFIPVFLAAVPNKTKIAAGLACGMLWTVSKGIKKGDIVFCPDGEDHYHVCEVVGDYQYQPDSVLPHQRPVHWFTQTIDLSNMSDELKSSARSRSAVCRLDVYGKEIEKLIEGVPLAPVLLPEAGVEDLTAFTMEKHLEDFLVQNWSNTDLGREYDIYQEEGEMVGQQYQTDTGPLDILAISKDKKTLLVVELKKGRASDIVVGQTMRYMGYVKEELAEKGQKVKGVIIALEDDQRIRRALSAADNIEFYRYQVSFKLVRA